MYLIYNTFTQEFDHADTPDDAERQYIATQEWLEEQRAYDHQVFMYESIKTSVIKEKEEVR